MSDVLKKTISAETANFIIEQVSILREQLEAQYANLLNEALDKLAAKKKQLEQQLEEERNRIEAYYKERESKLLEELEEHKQQLDSRYEARLDKLAEKVNNFLRNSRDEIYKLVEQEYTRTHSDYKIKLERIKALLEDINAEPDVSRLRQLERDINHLRERVRAKDNAIKRLNAKLRAYEVLDQLPDADKPLYESLLECTSPEEVDREYKRIKRLVEARRIEAKPAQPKSAANTEPPKPAGGLIDERILRIAGVSVKKK